MDDVFWTLCLFSSFIILTIGLYVFTTKNSKKEKYYRMWMILQYMWRSYISES